MATADEQVIVGGQRAVAVRAVEGEYIYDGGATDTQCVVKDGDKAQRATKVVVIGGDGNPLTIDDALSTDSENPVQNKVVTSAINANAEAIETINEELTPWQKPQEWIDIRQGAQPNSIYLLVGHAADFSKYNILPVKTNVNNSGTYDIYIDGVKQYSGVASGTETVINWQTLNLTSGFDVTYPEALRTHVVRITPTLSSNHLNAPHFANVSYGKPGILWVHFTIDYKIDLQNVTAASYLVYADQLEAVTSITGDIKAVWMEQAFAYSTALKEVPIINVAGGTVANMRNNFIDSKIRKLVYKIEANMTANKDFRESNLSECEEIINTTPYTFNILWLRNCPKLKRFQILNNTEAIATLTDVYAGTTSLNDTFLDYSAGSQIERLTLGGASDAPLIWCKGLVVSSSAPFTGTSPQLDVAYTGMDKSALINLFNSLPTVTDSQVCNITGATGAADLTPEDIAVAVNKGWTITR